MEYTDFGRIIHKTPRAVFHVSTESQLLDALREARRRGLPASIRGAGHSCGGQTVTDGALIINDPGNAAPRLLEDGLVEVPARLRWRQVERYLNARGRTIPVLADYLDLSVGGTLSVGGYGTESVVHGAQVDHVARIRLVTPEATVDDCSPFANAGLFGRAMAGLGGAGIIETAVLRTIPYQPFTVMFQVRHPTLQAMVASLGWLADAPQSPVTFFKALHARGRYVSTYGVHAASWREACAVPAPVPGAVRRIAPGYRKWRSLAVSLWLARFPFHARLWSDYLLDYEGLARFSAFVDGLMRVDAFRDCLQSIYILASRRQPRPVRFPLEATDAIGAPMAFGIGLYSMVPRGNPVVVQAIREALASCLEHCIQAGGRPYRYGWHELGAEQARAAYRAE